MPEWKKLLKRALPKPKLARAGIDLRQRSTVRKALAYSPEFKEFVHEHKGVLIPAFHIIQKNLQKLESGQIISDKKRGIIIERAATGRFKGGSNYATLKVSVEGKEFFVKIAAKADNEATLKAIPIVEEYLESIGHRTGPYNIQIIKPHVFFKDSNQRHSFLVTDFYTAGEVEQVMSIPKNRRAQLSLAIGRIGDALHKKAGIIDIGSNNAFYSSRTQTILMFDFKTRP